MPLPNTLFGIAFHAMVMLWLLSGLLLCFSLIELLLVRVAPKAKARTFAFLTWVFLFVYVYAFSFNAFGRQEWGHLVPVSLMVEITRQLPGFIQSSPVRVGPYLLAIASLLFFLGLFLFYRATTLHKSLQSWRDKKTYLIGFFIGLPILLTSAGKLYESEMPFKKSLPRLLYNYTKVHDPTASLVFRIIRGKEFIEENEITQYNFQIWDIKPAPGLQPRKNVVLIIVDALRADHLPLYGYDRPLTPFLDSLYRTGSMQRIRYATSACNTSFCGIMSIMKSVKWQDQGPYDFGLPDLLKQYGYQTNFLLSGPHKNWYGLGKLYGRDIDFIFEGYDSKKYNFVDDRLIFEGWDQMPASGRPQFLLIHLMSVHLGGTVQEAYQRYQPSTFAPTDALEVRASAYRNNYDNGILQADAMIAKIFERLSENGILDNALVIITSDHGEGIGEYGRLGHNYGLWHPQINIPILFFDTDSNRIRNDYYATQIDIAPTISTILGLPVPKPWQGRSLTEPFQPTASHHVQGAHQAVIRADSSRILQYISCEDTGEEYFLDYIKGGEDISHLLPDSTKAALRGLLHSRPSSSH